MTSQRDMVAASELAIGGSETERHNSYVDRRHTVRRVDDVKAAPMNTAKVRKMRQSRKRRKPSVR